MNSSPDFQQPIAFIAAALVLACLLALIAVFGVSVLGGGVSGMLQSETPSADPTTTVVSDR